MTTLAEPPPLFDTAGMRRPYRTYGSLFSGYGGLDRAVEEIFGSRATWHVEIDPAASKVLKTRWPLVPNLGDVSKIDWSAVPPVDVLGGGFPCTDLSTAGAQQGLSGEHSGLWEHMARAIAALRPRLVVIENVRGLLTSRGAAPTDELLAAWAERDRYTRVLDLIERKLRKAAREGNQRYVQFHSRDRVRIMGRRRAAVDAARRADALIVRAIGAVLGRLADLGYDAVWCGLPASAVGAAHGRFRIFILAWPADTAGNAGRLVHGDSCAFGNTPGSRWNAASAEAAEGPWQPAGGPGGPTADPEGIGWLEGRAESARLVGGSDAALCGGPTPADADGKPLREQSIAQPERGGEALAGHAGSGPDWGAYGPAIARWGGVLGRPAPVPTIIGKNGQPKLSPWFVEWLMGLPAGWVTDVPDISVNDMLKMLGNGVVPQQAAAAIQWLMQWVPAFAEAAA